MYAVPPPGPGSDLATSAYRCETRSRDSLPRRLIALVPLLAAALAWIVALCALSVIVLVLIVVAPWGAVRREPRLDSEVETRLLLGETPDEIDRAIAARDSERRAPVQDQRPGNEP